jgi:UDP-glucuronate decarboxylase
MGSPQVGAVAAELVRNSVSPESRFAVTGASGWLGRTALRLLAYAIPREQFSRRVLAFASAEKKILLPDGGHIEARPLQHLGSAVGDDTFILHFAYLTRDRAAEGLPQYVAGNCSITGHVLAALERGVAGLVLASSGAVYGSDGSLSTDLSGNPYGTLKHFDELIFTRAAQSVRASCVIARIFALGGAAMTKPDHYALGDLVTSALNGLPLTIRAAHPVFRSYAWADDVIALALLSILSGPEQFLVFDTGGQIVEIGELAERVRHLLGRPDLPIVRPHLDPGTPEDRYVGDRSAMDSLSLKYGLRTAGLDDIIRETAQGLGLRERSP